MIGKVTQQRRSWSVANGVNEEDVHRDGPGASEIQNGERGAHKTPLMPPRAASQERGTGDRAHGDAGGVGKGGGGYLSSCGCFGTGDCCSQAGSLRIECVVDECVVRAV